MGKEDNPEIPEGIVTIERDEGGEIVAAGVGVLSSVSPEVAAGLIERGVEIIAEQVEEDARGRGGGSSYGMSGAWRSGNPKASKWQPSGSAWSKHASDDGQVH